MDGVWRSDCVFFWDIDVKGVVSCFSMGRVGKNC